MKVDCVMWTKNGAETIDVVLKRINKIIPENVVNSKFIVDDDSTDKTREIAERNGWYVYGNCEHGIGHGANTALKNVTTDYFCSFEQDLYLSESWWCEISSLILNKPKVGAACGLRFLPNSNFFSGIEHYRLVRKNDYGGHFGKSLDNTIWRTDVLRKLGGFSELTFAGVDSLLQYQLDAYGFKWLVDYAVRSLHLHSGFRKELNKYYSYGKSHSRLSKQLSIFCSAYSHEDLKYFLVKLLKSPLVGLKTSFKMNDGRLSIAYPSTDLFWFLGYLRGRYT